ncbi:MAG: hypothetical protein IRZ16_13085 [Myxococcaceae bacterium]|nr:hypothetical protein [Myxococcaceae bacterium]
MRTLWAATLMAAAVVVCAAACGNTAEPTSPVPTPPSRSGGDGGEVDSGTSADAGADSGTPTDGGDDGGIDAGADAGPGPWPTDELTHLSDLFGLPNVQSVGIDDAYNIWLLEGDRIGVLRPGTSAPVWASGIGQAAQGFGRDALAEGSTVICGGAAGQAYVGYWTYDLKEPHRDDPKDPEFRKGDLDVVQLNADGTISLTEHLFRSAGTSQPDPFVNIGVRNSIDWHYDEDRSVLTCQKVMRGPFKGEVYVGTNHGVVRIRGLQYNAHRHVVWELEPGNLRIGYNYGLGIAPNGDVLIANEWKVGIATPPPALGDWELFGPTPWQLDTWNDQLNSLADMDYWRAFQQTTDGHYYLGSMQYGLWQMDRTKWVGSAHWTRVEGLPTQAILALAATDDGSLFIGTDGAGLWVLDAKKTLHRVEDVPGATVRQLVYDPTTKPSMLLVLTNGGLTLIRGR